MKDFFKLIYSLLTSEINIGEFHLPFNILEILLKLVLPIAASLFLYKIFKKWINHLLGKSKLNDEKRTSVFHWFKLVFRVIITIFIILLIVSLFGAQISNYLLSFGKVLTHPLTEGISIVTILLIIPVLYLGQFIGKIVQKITDKSLLEYLKLNQGTKQTFSAVIKNVTKVIVILFGLTIIGIDLSILLGLFGVVGIGLGFGLQGVVANLFAGLVIITSKPVKVGDHIIVDGTEGNLQEIRFLNSVVSTITHESIIIPNSNLIENPVHNFSFDDKSIIIKSSVQVSYNSDLDQVLEVLKSIGEKCPFRLKKKDVKSRVYSFDDYGITVGIICWIIDSSSKYEARSWINLEIWRTFKELQIEIPYPQVDLHLKKN